MLKYKHKLNHRRPFKMNTEEKSKLKVWWEKCPDKKIICIKTIFIVLLGFYSVYKLGYAFGTFLANIGF